MMGWVPFFTSQLLGVEEEGTLAGLIFVVVIAAAVISGLFSWLFLMNRAGFSKRRVYGYCLVGSGVAFPLLSLAGLFSDSALVMQGLVLAFIAGLPMAAVFMLPKGLTADIADYDAMITGERREAMFYAMQNFFEKVTHALPPGPSGPGAAAGRHYRGPAWASAGPGGGRCTGHAGHDALAPLPAA